MNLKLIAMTALFLISTSAVAARVDSEDVQNYGAQTNKTRAVISAAAGGEGERCDFGEPGVNPTSRLSTSETAGRAVCHNA